MGTAKFSSTLDFLVGFNVNLYVGEEVYKGKLLGVEEDHVILESENNYVFYYSIEKIQAITKNTKQFQSEEATAEFLKTQSLTEVLNSLKHSWVTILCLNKQKFHGVLSHVDADFATLISGEERILIKISHISNILKGFIEEKDESNQNENQDNAKNEDKQSEVAGKMSSKESSKHSEETSSKSSKKSSKYSEETLSKSSKEEEKSEEPVKVMHEQDDQETKVWSQSIKNVTDKLNEVTTQKMYSELKKQKEEKVQNSKKQEKQPERVLFDLKGSIKREEKSAKETKEVTMPPNPEPMSPVYKSKEVIPSQKHSAEENKVNVDQNKKDETKKAEQPVRGFRFAGEPVTAGEIERTSFFAGWPNRRNKTRF